VIAAPGRDCRDNSKKRLRLPPEDDQRRPLRRSNGPFDTPKDGTTCDPHLD
jgi:hypothetical protein